MALASLVMTNSAYEEVREVVETYCFLDEETMDVKGKRRSVPGKPRFIRPEGNYPESVAAFGQFLYETVYTRPDNGNGYVPINDPRLEVRSRLRYSQANTTPYSWSPGWRVVKREGDRVFVEHDDLPPRSVDEKDVEPDADGTVRIRMERELSRLQPSFFHILGKLGIPPRNEGIVRSYFNVCWQGAGPLVRAVTGRLNRARVPFRFKVLVDPQRFRRADAAVLYVPKEHFGRAQPSIRQIASEVGRYFKSPNPAFTKRIAPGWGIAEDPDNWESFGQNRSRLIAEGLWKACERGVDRPEERLRVVREHLESGGVDSNRPFLNRGSKDVY